ncbi:MAG: hypothetical protein AB7K09_09250 [Planctomycetota bacterium]
MRPLTLCAIVAALLVLALTTSTASAISVTSLGDLYPGATGSFPNGFTELPNGLIVFQANDPVNGNELWVTDGTVGGTMLLANLDTGSNPSNPRMFTLLGDHCYFIADVGAYTRLYRTDGTTTTYLNYFTSVSQMVAGNDRVFISGAKDTGEGTELFQYVPGAGVTLVADIETGAGSSSPWALRFLNDLLYFHATTVASGREPYVHDPAGPSTSMIMDINPGAADSMTLASNYYFVDLKAINEVVFPADDGTSGPELWKSNGSTASMVEDHNPGAAGSNPQQLLSFSDYVMYAANDGTTGIELKKTNGTTIESILDVNAGLASSNPVILAIQFGLVWMQLDDGIHGWELWVSNGQASGTYMVGDLRPGSGDSIPARITPTPNGSVMFTAKNDSGFQEAWISDGTTAALIGPVNSIGPNPMELTATKAGTVFRLDNGPNGPELFIATNFPTEPEIAVILGGTNFVFIPAGTSLDIGATPVGVDIEVPLMVGNVAPNGTNLHISGTPAISGEVNCTATLTTAPAASIVATDASPLVVTVNVTATGPFSYQVSIMNDDSDEGTYIVTISGDGMTSTPWAVVEYQVDDAQPFAPVNIAVYTLTTKDCTLSIRVRNVGTASLSLTFPSPWYRLKASNFNGTLNSSGALEDTIAPGGVSTVLTLVPTVIPSDPSAYTIFIQTDDPAHPILTIDVYMVTLPPGAGGGGGGGGGGGSSNGSAPTPAKVSLLILAFLATMWTVGRIRVGQTG